MYFSSFTLIITYEYIQIHSFLYLKFHLAYQTLVPVFFL